MGQRDVERNGNIGEEDDDVVKDDIKVDSNDELKDDIKEDVIEDAKEADIEEDDIKEDDIKDVIKDVINEDATKEDAIKEYAIKEVVIKEVVIKEDDIKKDIKKDAEKEKVKIKEMNSREDMKVDNNQRDVERNGNIGEEIKLVKEIKEKDLKITIEYKNEASPIKDQKDILKESFRNKGKGVNLGNDIDVTEAGRDEHKKDINSVNGKEQSKSVTITGREVKEASLDTV